MVISLSKGSLDAAVKTWGAPWVLELLNNLKYRLRDRALISIIGALS